MGVHQFLGGGGGSQNIIYLGNCLKRGGLDNLQGTWQKINVG